MQQAGLEDTDMQKRDRALGTTRTRNAIFPTYRFLDLLKRLLEGLPHCWFRGSSPAVSEQWYQFVTQEEQTDREFDPRTGKLWSGVRQKCK